MNIIGKLQNAHDRFGQVRRGKPKRLWGFTSQVCSERVGALERVCPCFVRLILFGFAVYLDKTFLVLRQIQKKPPIVFLNDRRRTCNKFDCLSIPWTTFGQLFYEKLLKLTKSNLNKFALTCLNIRAKGELP